MDTAFFYLFALLVLGGAILTITRRSAIHSAISLIVSLIGVAGLYLLQQAEFLFAVQVILYIGGIMVLFLFVIMLVNLRDALGARVRLHASVSGSIGLAVVALILYVYQRGRVNVEGTGASILRQGGNLQTVGASLYRDYLLPFEVASILLLVAMIGAIVLARQKT